MKILVTGGCGYKGHVLIPKLLNEGHKVVAFDIQWFGNPLEKHPNLKIIKCDIRQTDQIPLHECDAVVHLANIANDPSVELNPSLSWNVNVLATQQLAELSAMMGVKQFIYASSGSVYGIKQDDEVTENLTLVPISVYNKTKMVAERVLLSYRDRMKIHCVRPATVCGWSPRMRLDLTINMLTLQAFKNGKITVFGGEQTRPNINIKDMVRVYQHFLCNPSIPAGYYNAGFENLSIFDIAKKIRDKLPAEIIITGSADPRSYRLNSDKLVSTGFKRLHGVDEAIDDMIIKLDTGIIQDTPQSHTVEWMKTLNLHKDGNT